MSAEKAVFRGCGDVALVRYVVSVNGDILHVTDTKGLAELEAIGITRRMLGVSRRKAFRYDPTITDGEVANWAKMRHF